MVYGIRYSALAGVEGLLLFEYYQSSAGRAVPALPITRTAQVLHSLGFTVPAIHQRWDDPSCISADLQSAEGRG